MAAIDERKAAAKLDDLYARLQSLRTDSSDPEYNDFAAFFTEDCRCNFRSMREDPKIGRQATIDDLKDHCKIWHIVHRHVDAQSATTQGGDLVVFSQMSNTTNILGEILDPFQETAVVRFDKASGLITDFRLYSCRSPIVRILQEKTSQGPCSDVYMAQKEDLTSMKPKANPGECACAE